MCKTLRVLFFPKWEGQQIKEFVVSLLLTVIALFLTYTAILLATI